MKINEINILALLGLTLIYGCQDVIDLETPEGATQLVVEGWLNTNLEEQTIKISETLPYFNNSATPQVSGATVNVTLGDGTIINFQDQGNGDYVYDATATAIANVGDELTLNIDVNGKQLTAFSEMHAVPAIDSIMQEDRDTGFEDGIYCNFFSRDIAGVGDSYWIKTYQNNDYLSDPLNLNIAYDAGFAPGAPADNLIFIPPIRETMNPVQDSLGQSPWIQGDLCRVEIHAMSNDAFFFMESVRDQLLNSLNTIFAEPITNTPGNIVNLTDDEEVLGIFTAGAISSLEITIE